MRWRHIEVLQAVLAEGSISGAARLLHVSQPAVTRTLQHAETVLGYALFHRRGSRLVATTAAALLSPLVAEASRAVQAVQTLAHNLKMDQSRTVRIAAAASLAVVLLPAAMSRLGRQLASCRTQLSACQGPELRQKLALHEVDIGVALEPDDHPGVDKVELGSLQVLVAGLPSALGKYAKASSIAPKALASMNLIDIGGEDVLRDLHHRLARLHGWPPGRTSAQSQLIGLQLAALGEGVVLVDSISARLCNPALKLLALEPAVRLGVFALLPRGVEPSVRHQAVIRALQEELAGS